MSSTIRIKVQGKEYALRSQQSEQKTQRVVAFVEQELAKTAAGISVDTRDLTVLTLLNMAGQYLELKDQLEGQSSVSEERLEQLLARVRDNL